MDKKNGRICGMEDYYLAEKKRNSNMSSAWVKPEDLVLSERSQ
jgi:hypothetical protein